MDRPLSLGDDAALAEDAARGAAEAVERMFAAHGRYVHRVLLRMGVAQQDADDVCQEVFLTVFRRHGQLLPDSRETTWLYGICLRLAANHRRQDVRRRERPHAEVPTSEAASASEHAIDARRLLERLDVALEHLSPKKRDVFVLYELAEREMEEVAGIVGAPLKTCYSRLHAAREELRARLSREVKP